MYVGCGRKLILVDRESHTASLLEKRARAPRLEAQYVRLVMAIVSVTAAALLIASSAWAAPASINVTPALFRPGDTVTLSGSGFLPSDSVRCTINWELFPEHSSPTDRELAFPFTDGYGEFSSKVRIPDDLPAGIWTIKCHQEFESTDKTATFQVRALPRLLTPTAINPLAGDNQTQSEAIDEFGQATVASKNSIGGGDHAEVVSGGQARSIPGDPLFPTAINDSALVVGNTRNSSFDFSPWLCQFNGSGCAGGVKNLTPPLGGTSAFAAGINDAGVLVGKSDTTGDAAEHAYSCPVSTGVCTDPKDLGTLGGSDSTATAVAGNGQVVGSGDTTGDAATHAMVCPPSAATCTDLGTLNDGTDSEADAIDTSGDIVGWSDAQSGSGPEHAFLCVISSGACSMQDLGVLPGQPSGTYSGANAVTNYLGAPQVVGASGADGFIWSGGKMFPLDKELPAGSGVDTTYPEGINRYGQIITDTASGGTAILSPKDLIGQVAFTSSGIRNQGLAEDSMKTAASPVSVQQGGTVQWVNADSASHNVVDSSGMGLFHSGTLAPGRGYAFTFNAAGTYGYKDSLHSQTGSVHVPITTAPASGHPSTLFQIYFAAKAPPSGYVYDLQVKKPGASAFSSLLIGTKKTLASFKATAGTGSYSFRARIRNTGNNHTSGWSSVRTVSITP